jgi:cytochrome c oxidase cbb3-type subunit III
MGRSEGTQHAAAEVVALYLDRLHGVGAGLLRALPVDPLWPKLLPRPVGNVQPHPGGCGRQGGAGAAQSGDEQGGGRLAAAQTAGRITFANNCQPCHGAGGAGLPGYPALAAGAWIWGGKLEDIQQTVTHGIRSGDPDARDSKMLAFGTDGILKPEEIQNVSNYVETAMFGLTDPNAAPASIASGKEIYAANCAACHGEKGEGVRDVGGPRLASKVHLYGGTRESIVKQVTAPHMGVMPNWNQRLDAATIKSVAIYVHDLGGGE